MNPHKDLKTLLDEALNLRNVSPEKLAEITGVPERYIWALQNMEIDKLPPLPYIRGYLKKISEVLRLDHEELWELYRKELDHKTSGAYDRLPTNRYAIKRLSKTNFLGGLALVLIGLYLLTNLPRLLGEPNLTVTDPIEPLTVVSEPLITLRGQLNQRDKLLINNEEVVINPDNTFSQSYALQPGLNTIEFKASRFLGREKLVMRQIIYQPR